MLYVEPRGSRGKALHLDNFYLRIDPGPLRGGWRWTPVTRTTAACSWSPAAMTGRSCTPSRPTPASGSPTSQSRSRRASTSRRARWRGDMLVLHGFLVHGSRPNSTGDRFSPALIGHTSRPMPGRSSRTTTPALRTDGTSLRLDVSEGGGPRGEGTEVDGHRGRAL